jgi:hypothetical protein
MTGLYRGLTRSYPPQKQINPAYSLDSLFIVLTLLVQVLSLAVQEMCILGTIAIL